MERDIFIGQFVKRVTVEEKETSHGIRTYERVYIRDGVVVFVIPKPGYLRLINEKTWIDDNFRLKPVTGFMDDEETPENAARRELAEETGLHAECWRQLYFCERRGTTNYCRYFFLASVLQEGEANPEPSETIRGWKDVPFSEVRKMALRGQFGTSEMAYATLRLLEEVGSPVP